MKKSSQDTNKNLIMIEIKRTLMDPFKNSFEEKKRSWIQDIFNFLEIFFYKEPIKILIILKS